MGDMQTDGGSALPSAPPRARRSRLAVGLAGFGAGLALVLVMFVPVVIWLRGKALPELTPEALAAAETLWSAKAIADYDLEVKISGRQSGTFLVSVRRGEPVMVSRNGVAPRRGTWDTWTIPGQFDTLHIELANALDPSEGFGAPAGSTVYMRARFDDVYGYPIEYRRSVLGTPLDVEWAVTRFQPMPRAD